MYYEVNRNRNLSEKKFDQRFKQKINKNTLSSAVRNSFNGLSKVIPSNGTMDSALNITLESVKADIGKTWRESEITHFYTSS